jgi:hypothetical protein
MTPVYRLTVFFALATSVFAGWTLNALVNAAQGFALAIHQQIVAVQSITTPSELAEKTILYAAAKKTYYEALRAAAPELTDIASGKKPRPPEVDQFAQSFSVAGEKQEKAADEATVALLRNWRWIQIFKGRRPHSTKPSRSKKDSCATLTV